MQKAKNLLKVIIFLILLFLVILGMSRVLNVSDNIGRRVLRGFYEEPEGSLDAVYVGASNVYAYWAASLAWHDYGMTVFPYSVSALPAQAVTTILDECRQTQPNAVYIINLNSLKDTELTLQSAHFLLDYFPFSSRKITLVNRFSEELEINGLERLEFYFPFIRFHSAWSNLNANSFIWDGEGLRGEYTRRETTLNGVEDISRQYTYTTDTTTLEEKTAEVLGELLDYIETEQIPVLFIMVPQSFNNEDLSAELNTVCQIVEDRGFDVLNLTDPDSISEIGIDLTTDFYNARHMNTHGVIKYTHFLAEYLHDHYNFTDKRDDPAYDSWNEAYEKYYSIIAPFCTDFELDHSERDFTLEAPVLERLTACGQSLELVWRDVDKAEAYLIYRRYIMEETEDWSPWVYINATTEDINTYTDPNLLPGVEYCYTVVPIIHGENGLIYGCFNYSGISRVASVNAPELVSLETTETGNLLTWNAVEGVDGYAVYRKINGQNWHRIDMVGPETLFYNDTQFRQNVPYIYTVAAYLSTPETFDPKTPVKNDRNRRVL